MTAIPNVPKRKPREWRDYAQMITRYCPLCHSAVYVMGNYDDWKLASGGCGGRYD